MLSASAAPVESTVFRAALSAGLRLRPSQAARKRDSASGVPPPYWLSTDSVRPRPSARAAVRALDAGLAAEGDVGEPVAQPVDGR